VGTLIGGVLDTSVVIATEASSLPDEAAISVATLAELHFGVHMARADEARKARSYGAHAHAVAVYTRHLDEFELFRHTIDVYQA
jgi:predicted nucleic acid-binding protein